MEYAVKIAKQVGLKIRGYFILGFPTERYAEVQQTIDFAKKIDIDIASFTLLVPFPGTLDFIRAKKQGVFNPDFYKETIVSEINFLREPIFVPADMTKEGLLKAHKSAYNQYYFRPKIILKKLCNIRNKDDLINLIKGAYTLLANTFAGKYK